MHTIEVNGVSKSFGAREVIRIEQLKIEAGRRIGIVGTNGAGKTTLLRILAGHLEPDEGQVHLPVASVYWSQMEPPEIMELLPEMASRFEVPVRWRESLSGGEKTRYQAAAAFQQSAPVMLVDEPTTNLDMAGIEALEHWFAQYKGTLLLISHDRHLVDQVAHQLLVVENRKIHSYPGTYEAYRQYQQKQGHGDEQHHRRQQTQQQSRQQREEQLMVLENRKNHLIGRLSVPAPDDNLAALDEEYLKVLQAIRELKSQS